jgi:Ca2+-binding RTX toxin-like protein
MADVDVQGVDFIPSVKDFYIRTQTFSSDSGDVKDGAVTPGTHTVLRFDTTIANMGTNDFVIGDPADHPNWFEWSTSHNHYHFRKFNQYTLTDIDTGKTLEGAKQSFCLEDSVQVSTASSVRDQPFFTCSNQGISAGWADVYNDSLPGQYVVIDGITNGTYKLTAKADYGSLIPETNEQNNTAEATLSIQDGVVRVLIDGTPTIVGTSGNDTLTGTSGAETIQGLAGQDKLSGLAGDDRLEGGSNGDHLNGGSGSDDLYGGTATDYFVFSSGSSPSTTSGADTIWDWNVAYDWIDMPLAGKSSNYGEAATSATTIEAARAQVEGTTLRSKHHAFLYNSATDTGYLLSDLNKNGTFETGVIMVGAGSASDMKYSDIL